MVVCVEFTFIMNVCQLIASVSDSKQIYIDYYKLFLYIYIIYIFILYIYINLYVTELKLICGSNYA